MMWPQVLCRRCCAFPGEPCRVSDAGGLLIGDARRPHAVRAVDAEVRIAELRVLNVFDLLEHKRLRKAS